MRFEASSVVLKNSCFQNLLFIIKCQETKLAESDLEKTPELMQLVISNKVKIHVDVGVDR